MQEIRVCVFDAYGTLFDVAAAARALAAEPGREAFAKVWPQVASDWRLKQLQYSWLRAVSGEYCDFWKVTEDGLDWALARAGQADPALREALLGLYWRLAAYPEVPGMLSTLKGAGLSTAILSNGSPKMLAGAVDSAGIGPLLDDVLSVETVGIFKPARVVYDLVGTRFSCTPEEVLFVSSNGWDAAAGAAYGFRTLWVNRAGEPVDNLPGRPAHEAADLSGVPALLELT
jgi:2-haloacid dehalogenase